MEWRFEVPFMPPSVNKMYVNGRKQGVRWKSPELNLWQAHAHSYLNKGVILAEGLFRLEIELHARWFNVDGSVKKKDCSNYIKAVEDSLFKAIGRDDSEVFELTVRKIQSPQEKVLIRLSTLL